MRNIIILTGAPAVGKTYASRRLIEMFPDEIAFSQVHTTRHRLAHESPFDDRIFVSDEEFQSMVNNGEFFCYEQFAGSLYGYSRANLKPLDRHLIIDVSPYLLPAFANHSNVLIVGLQMKPQARTLLQKRMRERGDTPELLANQKPFIVRDMQDLARQSEFINRHGKLFEITNDNTISSTVVPWITKQLGLSE